MIYDCFLWNGEKDLLRIRAEEFKLLQPLEKFMPYKHVAIESKYTFTGIQKSYSMTPELIEKYGINWFPLTEAPDIDPWVNERNQRNAIMGALVDLGVTDDDVVIISDVDEIPRVYALQHYAPQMGLVALQMDIYHFYLNTRYQSQTWRSPRILPWSILKETTPDDVRRSGFDLALVNAGWHFTYQGGIDAILDKFKSFSHQEQEVQRHAADDVLRTNRHELLNVWGDAKLDIVPDEDLPYFVRTHREQFNHMLK